MNKYIPILLMAMAACTKEADIKLPTQEEKLVVTCFISPEDTTISAVVRTSSPKYNTPNSNYKFEMLTNAEVVISSADGNKTIPYDAAFECYTIPADDFPILPGRSYTLHIKTPDGKQTTASTTVPPDTLNIRSMDITFSYSSDSTRLEITGTGEITDIPGLTNYVAMYYRQVEFSTDTTFTGQNPYVNFGYGTFEDDEKQSRQSYVFQERQGSYQSSEKIKLDGFYAEFWGLNCSKEFYLYNRSIQMASFAGDNPFGDPVLVYTNMSNGFGCFGGFRVSKRSVLH